MTLAQTAKAMHKALKDWLELADLASNCSGPDLLRIMSVGRVLAAQEAARRAIAAYEALTGETVTEKE